MQRSIRPSVLGALAAALVIACGVAEAGFGHRHRHDPGCAAVEPGCSAFEPACAIEPACGSADDCFVESCCPTNPCIKYRHRRAHHCHRRDACASCCPQPTFETVLTACSPETGCAVDVPVCLPACCEGCPCQTSRCTVFGKGAVRFDYACGCSVHVRFQHNGDVLVTYAGF